MLVMQVRHEVLARSLAALAIAAPVRTWPVSVAPDSQPQRQFKGQARLRL
ncbi:MAG TPA: hypothetical protein VEL03_07685 [Streptosporangiaceae bacterium]|nr:hypothetical protein [Streptosporangiaceae bacterium]